METIISALKRGIASDKSETEVARALLQFQKEIDPSSCKKMGREEIISYFEEIWNILLQCSNNPATSIRLSTYQAVSAFLIKMTPFYTRQMKISFSSVVSNGPLEPKTSVILSSSFAFLSNFIAGHALQVFLESTPIFHHFIVSESLYSEYLSNAISNLADVGIDWFKNLLSAFLVHNQSNPSRQVMKAIASIVSRKPKELLKEIINALFSKDWTMNDITLIAFLITYVQVSLDQINFFPVAHAAFMVVKEYSSETTTSDITDCFQILSANSDSFKLDIERVSETELSMTLTQIPLDLKVIIEKPEFDILRQYDMYGKKNEAFQLEDESDSSGVSISEVSSVSDFATYCQDEILSANISTFETCDISTSKSFDNLSDSIPLPEMIEHIEPPAPETQTFDYTQFLSIPLFFSLPLPYDMILPKDDDSSSILTAKFKSIANRFDDPNDICDVSSIIEMLFHRCAYEYNDLVSAVLQCLEICVNTFIQNAKTRLLTHLLRRILFVKPVSWYHAQDILRVIRKINRKSIPILFGPTGTKDIFKVIIGFAMNPNDQLSQSSQECIIDMVDNTNFHDAVNVVLEDIDLFSPISVRKHLHILASIIASIKKVDIIYVSGFSFSLLEISSFYLCDIYTISSIYEYFASLDLRSFSIEALQQLSQSAHQVIKATINILSGNKYSDILENPYYEIVNRYLDSQTIEIIAKGANDFKKHYFFLYSAALYIFKLPIAYTEMDTLVYYCQKLFRFFPIEVTKFLSFNLMSKCESNRFAKIAHGLLPKLENINDIHTLSLWCTMALSFQKKYKGKMLLLSLRVFKTISMYYIKNYNKVPANDLVSFAHYIIYSGQKHERAILEMLVYLPTNKRNKFFSKMRPHIVGRFQQWFPPKQELEEKDGQMTGWALAKYNKENGIEQPEIEYRSYNTFFDKREMNLNEQVKYYIENEVDEQIDRFLWSHPVEDFDFTQYHISPVAFPILLNYLKVKEKNEMLKKLSDKLSIADLRTPYRDAVFAVMSSDPQKYVLAFQEAEHLTKTEIICLAKAVKSFVREENLIFALIIRLFDEVKSIKRIRTILVLAAAAIEHIKIIPNSFHRVFFDDLQMYSQYLCPYLCHVLYQLALKLPFSDEQKTFMNHFQWRYVNPSCDAAVMMRVTCTYHPLKERQLRSFIAPYFTEIATLSIVSSGLKFIVDVAKFHTSAIFVPTINSLMNEIITTTVPLLKNPIVFDSFTSFIVLIFTEEGYTCQDILGNIFTDVFPGSDRPQFIPFLSAIEQILTYLPANNDFYNLICAKCDAIVTEQVCFPLFDAFERTLEIRLMKIESQDDRQSELETIVLNWSTVNKNFDSYDINQYLNGWKKLFRAHFPMRLMLTMFAFQFLKMMNRFFPFFVSLAQLYNELCSFASPAEQESIHNTLRSAELMMTSQTHITAIECLIEEKDAKKALDLALIE